MNVNFDPIAPYSTWLQDLPDDYFSQLPEMPPEPAPQEVLEKNPCRVLCPWTMEEMQALINVLKGQAPTPCLTWAEIADAFNAEMLNQNPVHTLRSQEECKIKSEQLEIQGAFKGNLRKTKDLAQQTFSQSRPPRKKISWSEREEQLVKDWENNNRESNYKNIRELVTLLNEANSKAEGTSRSLSAVRKKISEIKPSKKHYRIFTPIEKQQFKEWMLQGKKTRVSKQNFVNFLNAQAVKNGRKADLTVRKLCDKISALKKASRKSMRKESSPSFENSSIEEFFNSEFSLSPPL